MLRQITQPKCFPVSVEEARQHQVVDSSDRSNDALLELLIQSATADSEMKTGRVWVECDWEWKPEEIAAGSAVEFPIVPVTSVRMYDLDEKLPDNEEEEGEPDSDVLTKREAPDYTDVAAEYMNVEYPSPEPLGSPMIGSVTPLKPFPENYRIILTVGYPTEEHEEKIEQFDNPVLVLDKCCYTPNLLRLVFNRPVSGEVYVSNFVFRTEYMEAYAPVVINNVQFRDGCVELLFDDFILTQGKPADVSFAEGAIQDEFGNFVQAFERIKLPEITFYSDSSLNKPEPVPTHMVTTSKAPTPIKNWILTRVGTLYSQRTEIALRAGKSNDAMFKDEFINNLLNPYQVRFL